MLRDFQRQKVYNAESSIWQGHQYVDAADMQHYVNGIVSKPWFQNAFPLYVRGMFPIMVVKSGKLRNFGGMAYHGSRLIKVTATKSIGQRLLLHETAHLISPGGERHGPVWVRNYLRLVWMEMGKDIALALWGRLKGKGVLIESEQFLYDEMVQYSLGQKGVAGV